MQHITSQVVDSGVPFGGLGTGTVELRADGLFYNWEIFNNPPWTSEIAGCCVQDNTRVGIDQAGKQKAIDQRGLLFLLWARKKGDTVAHLRLLALDNNPLDTNRFYVPYLRTPASIVYHGEFPTATLEYQGLGIPLRVQAQFTSSFVPSEAENSAIPGFYADFTVMALDTSEWEVSITAILTNATGIESPNLPKRNTVSQHGNATVILMDTPGATPDEPATGTLALAAEGKNVSYCAGYCWVNPHLGTPDLRYLFRDLYATGRLPDWRHGLQPPRFPAKLNVQTLTPVRREAFEKACREHYDISRWQHYRANSKPEPAGIEFGHTADQTLDPRADLLDRQCGVGSRWEGSLCLSGKVRKSQPFSARFAVGWHFPNHMVMDSETGDCPYRFNIGHEYTARFADAEAVVRQLFTQRGKLQTATLAFHAALYDSTIPRTVIDQISAQISSLIRCSWWTTANGFGIWEGLGCCGVHTTDVAYTGSIPIPLLFPKIAGYQLELTRRFQRPDGRIPHSFPASFAHPNDSFYRTDMMAQFVLMVYRDMCWTGDTSRFNDFYSSSVRAMRCMAATDADGNGLPDAVGADSTYDTWGMFGATAYMSGLFLAAMSALVEMAKMAGDHATESWASETFSRGRASFEKELWNGDYIRLWHRGTDGLSDEGCMADQFAGYWYAAMLGLAPHLDAKKTSRALDSIMRHNFVPSCGLANGAYPAGQLPPQQFYSNYMPGGVWTGIEYAVSSLLLYHGRNADATAILDDVYARHAHAAGLWRHYECGHYYYRPVGIWAVLLGYQGFQFNATTGSLALTTTDKKHRSLVSLGTGWGTFSRTVSSATLSCGHGELVLKDLTLHVHGKRRPSQVLVGAKKIAVTSTQGATTGTVRLTFKRPLRLTVGQQVTVTLSTSEK